MQYVFDISTRRCRALGNYFAQCVDAPCKTRPISSTAARQLHTRNVQFDPFALRSQALVQNRE